MVNDTLSQLLLKLYKNKLFQGENFEHAQQAREKLRPIALLDNCILAQLVLAWLIAQPQTNA